MVQLLMDGSEIVGYIPNDMTHDELLDYIQRKHPTAKINRETMSVITIRYKGTRAIPKRRRYWIQKVEKFIKEN